MIKELVSFFVKKLVDKPDSVVISEITTEGKYLIQIRVAPHDLGKVIGSEGRTFRALRAVVSLVSNNPHTDVVVDIIE